MKKKSRLLLLLTLLVMLFTALPAQAAKVKISQKKASITVGDKLTLKITGTSKKVKWATSDKKIATVSKKGVVKGKKAGKATITATVNGKQYKCKVTVNKKAAASGNHVQKLTLSSKKMTMEVGTTKQIGVTITPANAIDKELTWWSSNTSLATVDGNGNVTAVGVPTGTDKGIVYIYVEPRDKTSYKDGMLASCTITVQKTYTEKEKMAALFTKLIANNKLPYQYNGAVHEAWDAVSGGKEYVLLKYQYNDTLGETSITWVAISLESAKVSGRSFGFLGTGKYLVWLDLKTGSKPTGYTYRKALNLSDVNNFARMITLS